MTTFFSMYTDVAPMIADEMDLESLLHWRATCYTNYVHGSSSLHRTLTDRLRPFSPSPRRLVEVVTTHGALFSGELSLSFILRTENYRPTCVEIFASNFQYGPLCDAIIDDPHILHRLDRHSFLPHTLDHIRRRFVTETLILHLSNSSKVIIHQSYTSSPIAPITRALCTAFSNFVSGHSFGCSHPIITLRHRALLADNEMPYWNSSDTQSINKLLEHGFSLAVSPTAWPEYRWDFDYNVLVTAEECWRHEFLCPSQGRYFGDKGSLVGFFDPLGDDVKQCVEGMIAPFGPMVLWRLMSTFYCEYGCVCQDSVMDRHVTTIPVLFRSDPLNEMRERESHSGFREVTRFHRRFGRIHIIEP